MENTTIMVELSAIGDHFIPDQITERLAIKPTEQYRKGDFSKRNVERKESCWSISTGYVETLYVSDVLAQLINKVSGKESVLIDLKNEFDLIYKIFIIIKIEQNQKPAIYLESSFIEFANAINAEVDFDLYLH